jgi:ketosteroid isomerase-like protein
VSNDRSTIGDEVPRLLAEYYEALDDGRFSDAVQAFRADALYAVPAAGASETDPRLETVGRSALLDRLHERGRRPWRHELQLLVREGASCLLEGVGRDAATGEALTSFTASLQLDDEGAITRYLAYACSPAVTPTPAEVAGASGGDAHATLHHYFQSLDRGAFEEAAACFSDDVVYSHPPYRHTGIDSDQRVVFRGREELLAAFRQRGAQSFDHHLVAGVQRRNACLVEGLVTGLPGGTTGSFVSSLSLDGKGLIRRYVSFYCQPGVRRLPPHSSS